MGRSMMRGVVVRGPLAVMGVLVALVGIEAGLRLYPNVIPTDVRVNPPVRRITAHRDVTYLIKPSTGSLFHWLPGQIAPVSAAEDREVVRVRYRTDANGYRNDGPEQVRYDVVVVGDSYTEGKNVPTPWPARLATAIGGSVLNLGEDGAGPFEELDALERYGIGKRPRWAIMAYFEGNDLRDVAATEQATPWLVLRVGRWVLRQGVDSLGRAGAGADTGSDEGGPQWRRTAPRQRYRFPVAAHADGDAVIELAFFPPYLGWLTATESDIRASRNYLGLRKAFARFREIADAGGIRPLALYIPSKERVYGEMVSDPDDVGRLLQGVQSVRLAGDGYLELEPGSQVSMDDVRSHMDDQRAVVAGLAAEAGIEVVDLTPALVDRARHGNVLYYPYDTHWNQGGHELAASVVAGRLAAASGNDADILRTIGDR